MPPTYASTIRGTGGILATFRYSPLGLPSRPNLTFGHRWLSPEAEAAVPSLLVRRDGDWNVVPWMPDLWWTRLAVAVRSVTLGTPREALGEWSEMAYIIRWWL